MEVLYRQQRHKTEEIRNILSEQYELFCCFPRYALRVLFSLTFQRGKIRLFNVNDDKKLLKECTYNLQTLYKSTFITRPYVFLSNNNMADINTLSLPKGCMQLTLHVKRFIKFSTLEKDRLKQNVPKARAHHIELNRQTGISGIAQNCR